MNDIHSCGGEQAASVPLRRAPDSLTAALSRLAPAFAKGNRPEWLAQMKTDAGYAEAKSVKLLDPSSRVAPGETSGRWKIAVNGPVEFDA